jgi:hypothetical protein
MTARAFDPSTPKLRLRAQSLEAPLRGVDERRRIPTWADLMGFSIMFHPAIS